MGVKLGLLLHGVNIWQIIPGPNRDHVTEENFALLIKYKNEQMKKDWADRTCSTDVRVKNLDESERLVVRGVEGECDSVNGTVRVRNKTTVTLLSTR